MNIIISNASGLPIYEQICRQIKGAIAAGKLQPGEALPSIRALKALSTLWRGRAASWQSRTWSWHGKTAFGRWKNTSRRLWSWDGSAGLPQKICAVCCWY